jgi:DNA-binding CsgD family transcriptional regulator
MHRRREKSKQALAGAGRGREESGGALTPRERQIVQLIAEGRSSKEVAARLQISVKTVDTHRSNVMRKLNFHSVSELVRYAIRIKLVEP